MNRARPMMHEVPRAGWLFLACIVTALAVLAAFILGVHAAL